MLLDRIAGVLAHLVYFSESTNELRIIIQPAYELLRLY
jgi:hypothetical protein